MCDQVRTASAWFSDNRPVVIAESPDGFACVAAAFRDATEKGIRTQVLATGPEVDVRLSTDGGVAVVVTGHLVAFWDGRASCHGVDYWYDGRRVLLRNPSEVPGSADFRMVAMWALEFEPADLPYDGTMVPMWM